MILLLDANSKKIKNQNVVLEALAQKCYVLSKLVFNYLGSLKQAGAELCQAQAEHYLPAELI